MKMTVKIMSSAELKKKLEAEENLLLIDCRNPEELVGGYIQQAKLIPLSDFDGIPEFLEGKEEVEIVVQCRSGARSMQACNILYTNGFTNLSNLDGGILAWIEEGYPIKKKE